MKLKQKKNFFIRVANTNTIQEDKKKYITGCVPYHTRSCDLGGFTEIIEPTAFSKTLKDKNNVVLLYNHDDSKVLGATRSGTLKLESRDDGLYFSCLVNEDVGFARDAYSIISRGDCNTISFGFSPIKTENRNGIRHLKEVALSEISCCVPFPAYKDGYAAITNFRSYMMDNNINYELIEDALSNSDNLSDEQKEAIKELITSLQGLVKEISAIDTAEETKTEKPADKKADKKADEKEETINTEEPENNSDKSTKEAANGEQSNDTQKPKSTSDKEKTEEKEESDVDKKKLEEETEKLAQLLNLIDEEIAR